MTLISMMISMLKTNPVNDRKEINNGVLSVTSLDVSHASLADLFRCHARSPKTQMNGVQPQLSKSFTDILH
jgi:hypothetical protein